MELSKKKKLHLLHKPARCVFSFMLSRTAKPATKNYSQTKRDKSFTDIYHKWLSLQSEHARFLCLAALSNKKLYKRQQQQQHREILQMSFEDLHHFRRGMFFKAHIVDRSKKGIPRGGRNHKRTISKRKRKPSSS